MQPFCFERLPVITTLLSPRLAEPLFACWSNVIVQACLQGTMGTVYAPYTGHEPRSAVEMLGDFAFYGGEPTAEVAQWRPNRSGVAPTIAVGCSPAWDPYLEQAWGAPAKLVTRYAFASHDTAFDCGHLETLASAIPAGYELAPIDESLYDRCRSASWSRDFVANFSSYGLYAERGRGWVALYQGEPVAGASSYVSSLTGIEVQVETVVSHRRQGLARACSARLIHDCLDQDIHPSWDAANEASARLAQQLGYGSPQAYRAYTLG